MEIDRRKFFTGLGGVAAARLMGHEAKRCTRGLLIQ